MWGGGVGAGDPASNFNTGGGTRKLLEQEEQAGEPG